MSSEIRVLFLIPSLVAHGAERQLCELVREMDASRFELHVAVFYDPEEVEGGDLTPELRGLPHVRLHSLHKRRGAWGHAGLLWRLGALVRRVRPDILHGYMDGNLPALLVGRALGVRVVWGIRRSAEDPATVDRQARRHLRWMIRLSRFVDLALFNSESGLESFAALGVKARRMAVIPNGFDTARFAPDPALGRAQRAAWGVAMEVPLIGMVGRLDPVKDHATFLRAASWVAREHPEARFVCVGEGSLAYGEEMKALVRALGLEGRVLWPGASDRMPMVYNALSLLVLASHTEGFPNVLGEAMACGVPCVATRAGDAERLVGAAGWVVPPGDPEALAGAIHSFLEEAPEARQVRSREGRKRVVRSYGAAMLARRTEDALAALMPDPLPREKLDAVFLTNCVEAQVQGGAETQMMRIARTLYRRGWRVGVLTMLESPEFRIQVPETDIPFLACSKGQPRAPFLMAFRMIRQLRVWRPAVLVSFNYQADILGRVCGRLAGVRAILASLRTVHLKTPLREWLYRLTEPLVTRTISNSQAGVEFMVSRHALSRGKVAVIPNGIISQDYPLPMSREEARAEFELPPGAFLWLAVGNLRPAKDYPTLLEAAAHCANRSDRFYLRIAGAGDHLESLQADLAAGGLAGRVELLGSRLDVPRLLRAADALVLSSAWEGMPNTVMEAMASGLPVVATQVGGVAELMAGADCGFLVPPRDPLGLAGKMLAMMSLPEAELQAMGSRGRERIRTHFDHERIAGLWEAELRRVMPEAPGPPRGIRPAFVISLDFELLWGMRDKQTIQTYGDHILGEREAIPAMLKLFRAYGVRATWASVGLTLFDRKEELLRYLPDRLPTYRHKGLDPYAILGEIGDDERADPYHYGLSLIRQVLDCEGQEVGSHTFSHFYCLEDGQTADQFRADLHASVAATERLTARPASLAFPRNQFNARYLEICSKAGFEVFRGNEDSWMYRESAGADQSSLRRGARLLDHYFNLTGSHGFVPTMEEGMVNCPASRFFRPYCPPLAFAEGLRLHRIRCAMEAAAKEGRSFHLWWHPHNFGTRLKENLAGLEHLLRHHADLRERYGVASMNMGEVGRMARAAGVHPWARTVTTEGMP